MNVIERVLSLVNAARPVTMSYNHLSSCQKMTRLPADKKT